jgi:meso-butanediol dehydrogenase/(S,S)-butanediol dehydrogenase/diacetyl reductase
MIVRSMEPQAASGGPGPRFDEKVVLITGAGSGIGRAAAVRFASEGATVIVADIDEGAAAETVNAAGARSHPLHLDVLSTSSIEAGLAAVAKLHGGLDVLVNNAGALRGGAIDTATEEDWDFEIAINLKSIFLMSRAAWPLLRECKGNIVNTASNAGIEASAGQLGYRTAKAGNIMLTKCMALDGAKVGVRVNCVCPGATRTPLMENLFLTKPDEFREEFARLFPLGRIGEPTDVAAAMAYLASDDAAWVTGTALVVDGGWLSGEWHGAGSSWG